MPPEQSSNARKTATRLRHHLTSVGRVAVEVAPVLAALSRASHPVAWLGAVTFVAQRIWEQIDGNRPSLWPTASYRQRCAVLSAAVMADAGYVKSSANGVHYRVLDGVTFAATNEWCYGPVGTGADTIQCWLWDNVSRSLVLTRDEAEELSLTAEPCMFEPPSRLACSIAEECADLHSSGARVGLLIDGPPGSGKSEALLHVASRLGGRTLRADLKTVAPKDVVGIASIMKPDAVVLDDIDRGPTDGALWAVDRLLGMRVAVLASSNVKAKICDALIRDMRIDDHRTFGAIEPDVLEHLAAGLDLSPDLLAELATRTVATVARFLERRRSLGEPRALELLRRSGTAMEESDAP